MVDTGCIHFIEQRHWLPTVSSVVSPIYVYSPLVHTLVKVVAAAGLFQWVQCHVVGNRGHVLLPEGYAKYATLSATMLQIHVFPASFVL